MEKIGEDQGNKGDWGDKGEGRWNLTNIMG
jgi:hypothetical protein